MSEPVGIIDVLQEILDELKGGNTELDYTLNRTDGTLDSIVITGPTFTKTLTFTRDVDGNITEIDTEIT